MSAGVSGLVARRPRMPSAFFRPKPACCQSPRVESRISVCYKKFWIHKSFSITRSLNAMKRPEPLEIFQPKSLQEASALVKQQGSGGRFLAGGTDLLLRSEEH